MALPSSGQISMLDIYQEKTGFSSGRRDGDDSVFSLTGFSVDGTVVNPGASNNARDFIHDGDINEFRDGSPNQSAPYRMSEFHGYASAIQTVANQTVGTASFAQIVTSGNNFVVGGGTWQLINKSLTTGVSGELQHFWYIEEKSSGLPGSYNGSAMITGANYGWHRVVFDSNNIPDSYYIDVSNTVTVLDGTLQNNFIDTSGSGETYTSGNNWDNTVYTLLPTSNSGTTAFGFLFSVQDECDDYSIINNTRVKIYYRKSGYPDLLAVDRTITTELDGYWTASICQ